MNLEIDEDTAAADNAIQPAILTRGIQTFEVEDSNEFHSFQKGVKSFHRWKKHTKSEEIRKWANENPNKDFYVKHQGNHMLIKRSKEK